MAGGFFHNGIVVGVCYTVGAALVLFMVRAGVQTFQKAQVKDQNERNLKGFFFDTPADTKTGVPFRQGWTSKVDETLAELVSGQAETHKQLQIIGKAAGVERKRVHDQETP